MAAIFGRTKFFLKTGSATQQSYPVGQKFCRNRSISSMVFEIQAFLCFAFLEKIQKFKIAAIFSQVKYLFKLGKTSLH